MFISAVKLGILKRVLMAPDFFLQPVGATLACLLVECSCITLLHWLNFSEGEAPSVFHTVYALGRKKKTYWYGNRLTDMLA